MVAPWLDPEKNIDPDFFDFDIDANLADKTQGLSIMYSTDDFSDILTTVDILKAKLNNATFREFNEKGHFVLDSMNTEKFPELLIEALS